MKEGGPNHTGKAGQAGQPSVGRKRVIKNEDKLEVRLEFYISKAKLILLLLLPIIVTLSCVYVLLFSTQLSAKVYVALMTIIVITIFAIIAKNLIKNIGAPALIFDTEGIYLKRWNSEFIPWSNVKFIWSRPYSYPRRLCIETIDQSPSEFPRSVLFSALTPGFKEAWNYLNIYHPGKLERAEV